MGHSGLKGNNSAARQEKEKQQTGEIQFGITVDMKSTIKRKDWNSNFSSLQMFKLKTKGTVKEIGFLWQWHTHTNTLLHQETLQRDATGRVYDSGRYS